MNPINPITCPPEGDKILSYYKDYYESVFLIFHPFIVAKRGFEFNYEDDFPDKKTVLENFDKIKWSEMLRECDFDSFNRLDIALRNWIGGLAKKYQNPSDVEKLERVCQQFKIIEPNEGHFQYCIIDDIISSIKDLGYEKMCFGDEWGEKLETKLIAEIESQKGDIDISLNFIPLNIFTEDNNILYSVHWDSHFTLLCSSLLAVTQIVDKYQFEGFYANDDTEIYWSLKD